MKIPKLGLPAKLYILVAVPLIAELLFVGMLMGVLKNAEHEIWRRSHSNTVLTESNSLINDFVNSTMAIYIYGTTGADSALERYKDLSQQIPETIRQLKIDLRDSPNAKEAAERITSIGNHASELLSRGSEVISDSHAIKRIAEHRDEMEKLMATLTSELKAFIKEQAKAEQINPNAEIQSRQMVKSCVVFGILLNTFIAISLTLYLHRDILSRIYVLMSNTVKLTNNEPLQERLAGGDEISTLDHVFHNMAEALAEAARRKQEIVSMVSHDLRTPLTSVQASLTLLSEGVLGPLPARAGKEVTNAENNTARLINLINDLLDFEKLEAGQLAIERKITAVTPLLERSYEAVKAFADKQKVEIKVVPNEHRIYADGDRIIQILINLLSNAIKFSPAESVVILDAVPKEEYVELRVTDQGRGIPESFRKNMFQRFQQVDQIGDAKTKKGTGLGLAICKSLVELHNGIIGVDSVEGQGSTFWIRIPKEQPTELLPASSSTSNS